MRARIYKTYSLTCPAFEADFTTKFYFPWDFHGNFHVGSKATLKCLPGYVLPKQYKPSGRKKRATSTADMTGTTVTATAPPLPELDYDANTQTVECIYDPTTGGTWNPDTIGNLFKNE